MNLWDWMSSFISGFAMFTIIGLFVIIKLHKPLCVQGNFLHYCFINYLSHLLAFLLERLFITVFMYYSRHTLLNPIEYLIPNRKFLFVVSMAMTTTVRVRD